jgi:hypothetical protein
MDMDAEDAVIAILVFVVGWTVVGKVGYGMANQARFDDWHVPKIKEEEDYWFKKLCLLGGPITVLLAGVILVIQSADTMAGN